MGTFIETSAPAREERLKAGIAFCGNCKELKCSIMENRESGCLQTANRSFSQSHGCQFTLSLGILNTLRNAVVIMHGPIGCGFCSTASIGQSKSLKQLRDSQAKGLIWLSTNLDESDVIAGGEARLIETIQYADREFRPEIIVVVSSCVPALIGDDIDSFIDHIQPEIAAPVLPVNCEGFKTKLMATAYDAAYNGIMKKLAAAPQELAFFTETDLDKEARKFRNSRKVNIFNVGSMSFADETEIKRLLNSIGLEVSFLPCYSEAQDFSSSLEAALNVSICGTHDDYYLQYLWEQFHIPYLIDTIPIGRKNTDRWILKIAAFFHLEKEAAALIRQENEVLNESLDDFRGNLQGKRAYVSGGELRIVATAEVVQDLGMELVAMKSHHIDDFILPAMEALENTDDVFFSVATQQPFEQVNIVNRLQPDVIIMHTGGGNVTAKHGLPVVPLYGAAFNYMGYSGVFEIARKINKIVKNFQFNRNIKLNCPHPYRQEWLSRQPFHYIKAGKN